MKNNAKIKRIFIADPSLSFLKELQSAKEAEKYQIETCSTGAGCFEKIKAFSPDLVLLDLFLSEIHGIAILRKIKNDPKLKGCGVIIASDHILIQNHHASLQSGAEYFLNKPFSQQEFFSLADRFFLGELKPTPFQGPTHSPFQEFYDPQIHSPHRYLRFWGTRGSNSVSGPEFLRFGGNTCCLEVSYEGDTILIDSGTGICPLGEKLIQENRKKISLFLSHTHWDHITGFPFFKPIYDSKAEIDLWTPFGFEKTPKELFTDMLAYPYFPVRLEEIKAKIHFKEIREGSCIEVGKIKIWTHYAFHPGATLCFKIQAGDKTFGVVTDNEFLMGYHGAPEAISSTHPKMQPYLSFIEFIKGCDFIIHEAQYFPEEYLSKVGWGHSSVTNACILIRETGIKEWIVTHHDPYHTDEKLQKKIQLHEDYLEESHIDCKLIFAYDGFIYPL